MECHLILESNRILFTKTVIAKLDSNRTHLSRMAIAKICIKFRSLISRYNSSNSITSTCRTIITVNKMASNNSKWEIIVGKSLVNGNRFKTATNPNISDLTVQCIRTISNPEETLLITEHVIAKVEAVINITSIIPIAIVVHTKIASLTKSQISLLKHTRVEETNFNKVVGDRTAEVLGMDRRMHANIPMVGTQI